MLFSWSLMPAEESGDGDDDAAEENEDDAHALRGAMTRRVDAMSTIMTPPTPSTHLLPVIIPPLVFLVAVRDVLYHRV